MSNLFPFALGVVCTAILLIPVCFHLERKLSEVESRLKEKDKTFMTDAEWESFWRARVR